MVYLNRNKVWETNSLEKGELLLRGKKFEQWTEVERKLVCKLLAEHMTDTSKIYRLLDSIGRTGEEIDIAGKN